MYNREKQKKKYTINHDEKWYSLIHTYVEKIYSLDVLLKQLTSIHCCINDITFSFTIQPTILYT